MWDGERIGRRKIKKSAWGTMGRRKRGSEASAPLPPHLFFLPIVPGALSFFRELKPRVK